MEENWIWKENKEIPEGSSRNVEEETTRSWTVDYARHVLDLANFFDELSLN